MLDNRILLRRTIVDAVQHGKQVGVNDPDFYGKTIELVGKIADPNMRLRLRIV